MKNQILISLSIACLFSLSAPTVFAAGSYGVQDCKAIYGGGESCVQTGQVTINKTVKNPQTAQFVDNLSTNDAKYSADQTVVFKITVTNVSNATLSNVTVKDVLPEYVEFVEGAGNFDKNSRTLSFVISKLNPNEVRDFFVSAKVVPVAKLPKDQDIMCLVNQATVSMDNKMSQDNSQFCVQKEAPKTKGGNPPATKGGLPVMPPTKATTTPPTGPESLALFGLIPTAGAGLFLRKKSK